MDQLLKQMLPAGIFLFVFAGQATADSLSSALRAYEEGNHAKAAKLLKPLAAKGNAVAQFKLGTLYYSGKGVARNFREAERLYRQSAERGHVVAQSNLATMYYSGTGVQQDFVLAHMWKSIAVSNADDERKQRYKDQLNALAMNMNSLQIIEAQELAKQCTANKFKGCKRKR